MAGAAEVFLTYLLLTFSHLPLEIQQQLQLKTSSKIKLRKVSLAPFILWFFWRSTFFFFSIYSSKYSTLYSLLFTTEQVQQDSNKQT